MTPPQRRGSWFSSMALKLSGSPGNTPNANTSPTANGDEEDIAPLPKITPSKNAVLPHAQRPNGDAPYVPAPPRSGQPGFLGVFRRLSSTNNINHANNKIGNGLVDRKVLNVDKNRERCRVIELPQAKLRRVAFCVDVEIAPMPKYAEDGTGGPRQSAEKIQKKKIAEKGEGEALKHPEAVKEQKEEQGVVQATGEELPKEPKEGTDSDTTTVPPDDSGTSATGSDDAKDKDTTRKKEKKKGKEAERKAKKEQKRKEALEKGAIPMEIHLDSDSSSDEKLPAGTLRVQSTPTTNPARIYRRCCQLRETDILTKVTLQLPKSTSKNSDNIVDKLDLTGYFLSLQDLITLGDFLAIVPVREVILEDCGLTDEGMRVVLAGLLAARRPRARRRKSVTRPADLTPQGGVVERLVLKNNKIGVEGWKHIFTFIHLCRSIKYLDLSSLTFPAPIERAKTPAQHHLHFPHMPQQHSPAPLDLATLFSRALGDRLGGKDLELLNMASTGITSEQLKSVVDGCIKSGLIRLGLANDQLDVQAIEHVARFLREGRCEGLDLGGNDLRDHVDIMGAALEESKTVWALSLANCNLHPPSLAKLLPALVSLPNFKFLDLSHNRDLFESEPSALGQLRR